MQMVLLPALLASALLLVVAGVAMLVIRFRGQAIPTWLIRLAVVVLALQSGTGGIVFIRTPLMLISIALQTAVIAWFLWRGGRRTTTGLLLIGTGLLGALWWGYYVLEDLLDPLSLYETVLWLWWAPSVILVVAGAALLPLSDRVVQKPIFPVAPSLKRDPMPVATAITREMSFGPLPLPTIVADGVAVGPRALARRLDRGSGGLHRHRRRALLLRHRPSPAWGLGGHGAHRQPRDEALAANDRDVSSDHAGEDARLAP
jgi:hypothetical protein